ncbi:MAG: amino acid ABC transporter ATP-binding protein [Chloroflexota bacterium]|nr:amino acid ABC transporter ATP-binding protein [Chloroflexota bacterium]
MDDLVVEVEDLHLSYGDLKVLRGLTFSIKRGEVLVVVGASGSGKSTLLRCLNRLEDPDSGRIVIDGVDATDPKTDLPATRAKIGMVFQNFNLFPHMTALGNVAEGPRTVLRMSKEEAERVAIELLEKVGVADKKDVKPAMLSGGQQQRVAIARSLAMQPKVMMFDEPTSALDPELVAEVLDSMRLLAVEGMTMIVVTHEMVFAELVAHRVMFIDEGMIVEEGPPQEIFHNARHERTRQFLRQLQWEGTSEGSSGADEGSS